MEDEDAAASPRAAALDPASLVPVRLAVSSSVPVPLSSSGPLPLPVPMPVSLPMSVSSPVSSPLPLPSTPLPEPMPEHGHEQLVDIAWEDATAAVPSLAPGTSSSPTPFEQLQDIVWDRTTVIPPAPAVRPATPPAVSTNAASAAPAPVPAPAPAPAPAQFRTVPGPLSKAQRLQLWLTQARRHAAAAGLSTEVRYSVASALTLSTQAALAADRDWAHIIEKDVPRTGIHRVFREVTAQATLSRLLRAFTRENPSVGYLQSLAPIGAVLLLVANMDEDAALELLTMLAHVYFPTHFDDGLRGLLGDLDVFHLLLADRAPDLYAHLLTLSDQETAHPGDPPVINAFVGAWLSTLFIYVMPLPKLLTVWDAMFTDGSEVVLRCILSLFLLMKDDLMRLRTALDFYAQLQSIPTALANRDDPLFPNNSVLTHAYSLAPFPWPGLARMRTIRSQSLTHSTSLRGATSVRAEAADSLLRRPPRDALSAVPSTTSRPLAEVADAEAWDDVTFSAPALRYFGLQRPPGAHAGSGPQPAAQRVSAPSSAQSPQPLPPATESTIGGDDLLALDMDTLDDALDDVDIATSVGDLVPHQPPEVRGQARAVQLPQATTTIIAGASAPITAGPRPATGAGAAHAPVAVAGGGGGAAWELVDPNEASDAVMQAEAPVPPPAVPFGASAAMLPVAGFGMNLIALLSDYYQQGRQAAASAVAQASVAALTPAQPGWVPVTSATVATSGDASFYDFIADRLQLKDPGRDPRLKQLAAHLSPDSVERTIQRYRLWHVHDGTADEQNDVLAEIMRTVHRSRTGSSEGSSAPAAAEAESTPGFLGTLASFVARQLDRGAEAAYPDRPAAGHS